VVGISGVAALPARTKATDHAFRSHTGETGIMPDRQDDILCSEGSRTEKDFGV